MAATRGLWRTWSLWSPRTPLLFPAAGRPHSSGPRTSLSGPPWPQQPSPVPEEEERGRHAAVVSTVNRLIQQQDFGRLFAVVHFAGRQWKVRGGPGPHREPQSRQSAASGPDEKVLLSGGDFTLAEGRAGEGAVRVEATVLEKTESWPKSTCGSGRDTVSSRRRSSTQLRRC
ncbi:unnamed protein product [Pleuronectes platessa]|uniref:Large ribosomal subunit protein bL21m n=1 Tax=Pleuronectes platessa TaxID=8262 RepID=A0A9N7VYF2_PLEPL|nr:unnamed protein product [Pleuronectes platessa]